MYLLTNVSLERLEEINKEREETEKSIKFQQWIKEFNVGRMSLDKTLLLNAREVMKDWDISRFKFIINK